MKPNKLREVCNAYLILSLFSKSSTSLFFLTRASHLTHTIIPICPHLVTWSLYRWKSSLVRLSGHLVINGNNFCISVKIRSRIYNALWFHWWVPAFLESLLREGKRGNRKVIIGICTYHIHTHTTYTHTPHTYTHKRLVTIDHSIFSPIMLSVCGEFIVFYSKEDLDWMSTCLKVQVGFLKIFFTLTCVFLSFIWNLKEKKQIK